MPIPARVIKYTNEDRKKKKERHKPSLSNPKPPTLKTFTVYSESYYPAATPAQKPAASAPKPQHRTCLLRKYHDMALQLEQPCQKEKQISPCKPAPKGEKRKK
jgi:hypothetical protein